MPKSRSLALTSGSAATAATSRWILSTIAGGVPAGATSPAQVEISPELRQVCRDRQRLQVRQRRERPVVELGERAELAVLDQREARRHPVDGEIDAAGQKPLHDLGAALVRDEHGVDAGEPAEQIAGEPRGDDAGAVVELAGIGLGLGDQLLHGLRAVGANDQQRGVLRGQRDRREVLKRVVGQILGGDRVHHQRDVHGDQQRVAVRRGLRDLLCADRGIAAGAVLDHDRLAPALGQLLAEQACHEVGRPARRERHDELHRPGWERIRRVLSCARVATTAERT